MLIAIAAGPVRWLARWPVLETAAPEQRWIDLAEPRVPGPAGWGCSGHRLSQDAARRTQPDAATWMYIAGNRGSATTPHLFRRLLGCASRLVELLWPASPQF